MSIRQVVSDAVVVLTGSVDTASAQCDRDEVVTGGEHLLALGEDWGIFDTAWFIDTSLDNQQ
jgi:hypothetical protein